MARIREYELDRDLEINDKVLGTDATGGGTMNFSIEQLGEFLASRGLADPSALDFQFQHVDRVDGSISEGGISYNSTAPIELTSVYIGATDLKGLDTEPFAAVLVGTVIEINDTQASQGTDYGFYDVTNSVAIQGGFELTVVLHEAVVDLIESTASVPQTEFINISIIGLTGSTGDVGPVGFTPEITDNGDGTAAVGYVRVTNAPAPSSITLPIGPQGFSIDGLSTQYMGGDGVLDTTPELGDDTIITLSLDDTADTDLPSFTIPGGITGMVGPQGPVGEGTHGTDINASINGELLTITETEYASPTDTVGTTTTIVNALDIVGADGIDGTHGTDVRASRNGDLLTITQTVYANASDTVGATTDIFRDVDIVGDDGAAGLDGRTLLSGAAAPVDSTTGEDGDFYIQFVDADSTLLFGPRTSGLWGTGVELQGTDGATFDPATLTGDITATTAGVVTIVDDSHNHIIANVDGLQDALDIRPAQPATPATTSLYNLQVTDGGVASFELLASDLPDSPSGIAEDTVVNYNLTLTDVSGTETLTWTEDTGGGADVIAVADLPDTADNNQVAFVNGLGSDDAEGVYIYATNTWKNIANTVASTLLLDDGTLSEPGPTVEFTDDRVSTTVNGNGRVIIDTSGITPASGDQVAVTNGVVDLNLGLNPRTIPLSMADGNGLQNSLITEPIANVVGASQAGIVEGDPLTGTTITFTPAVNPTPLLGSIGNNVRVTGALTFPPFTDVFEGIGVLDSAGINSTNTAFEIVVTFPNAVAIPPATYTVQEIVIGIDIAAQVTLSSPGFTLPGSGLTTLLAIDEDGLVVEGTGGGGGSNAPNVPTGQANDTSTDYDLRVAVDNSGARTISWEENVSGTGGETNQNAFSSVVVSGQTTVAADTTTDSLTLVGGGGTSITTDATTDTITISSVSTSSLTLVTEDTNTDTVTVAGDLDVEGTLEVNVITATDQASSLTAGTAGLTVTTDLAISEGDQVIVVSAAEGNSINLINVDDDEELYFTFATDAIASEDVVTDTVYRVTNGVTVGSTLASVAFTPPLASANAPQLAGVSVQFFAAREVSNDTVTFVDDVEFLGGVTGVTSPADAYAFFTSELIEFEETIGGTAISYTAVVSNVIPDLPIDTFFSPLLNTTGIAVITGLTALQVTDYLVASDETTTGRKYVGLHGVDSLGFVVGAVAENQTDDGLSTGTANATTELTIHLFFRATNAGQVSIAPDSQTALPAVTFAFGNRYQLVEFEDIVRADQLELLNENPLSSTSTWVQSPGEAVAFENLLTETIFRTDGSSTTAGDVFRANIDESFTGLNFSSWRQSVYTTRLGLGQTQEQAIDAAAGVTSATQIFVEGVEEPALLDWITSDQAEGYIEVVPSTGSPAKVVARVNATDTLLVRTNGGGTETDLENDLSNTSTDLWDVVLDLAWGAETVVSAITGEVTEIFFTEAGGTEALSFGYDRIRSTVSELADVRPDIVDQTYIATSSDAQSGTAVAQAIAGNVTDISTNSDATQVTITETFVDGSQQTSFIPGVTNTISGVMLPAEFIQLGQLPDAIPAAASTGTSDAYLLSISDARAATWTAAPAVPSNNNQLTNGAGFVTGVDIFETGDPSSPVSNIQNIRFVGNGVDLSVEGSGGDRTAVITIQQSGSGVAAEEVENVALSISGFDQHEAAGAQTLTYSGTFTISAGLAANLASDAFTVTLTAGGSDVTITQSSSGNNYTYAGTSSVTFDATNSVDFVFSVSVEDADGNTFSGAATESLGPVAVSRAYTSTFTAPDSLGSGRAINNTADFSYIPNGSFTATALVPTIVGASSTDLTPTYNTATGVITVSSGSLTDITTGEYTIRMNGTFTETAVTTNTGNIFEAMTFDVFNSYFTGVVNTDPGAAVPSPYSGLTQSAEAITRGTQATFAYSGTGGATQYFIIVLHNSDLSGSEVTIAYPDTPGFILTPDIYTGATHTTLVVPFNQGHTITINI